MTNVHRLKPHVRNIGTSHLLFDDSVSDVLLWADAQRRTSTSDQGEVTS